MAEIRDGEGIKPSKKYANGTIHENASGKFQVLDRWLETEDNTIYLKVQWLDSGQIEVNKEVNINASIWKFERKHGITTPPVREQAPLPEITLKDLWEINQTILETQQNHFELLKQEEEYATQHRQSFYDYVEKTNTRMQEQHDMMNDVLNYLKEYVLQRNDLVGRLEKLETEANKLKKNISEQNHQIDSLLQICRSNTEQLTVLIKQNDLASKLIEKM